MIERPARGERQLVPARGEHAHVDAPACGLADARDLAAREHADEPRRRRRGERRDAVEHERRAVRRLDEPATICRRARLAEELRLDRDGVERRAVDREQRCGGARGAGVDGARDDVLPTAPASPTINADEPDRATASTSRSTSRIGADTATISPSGSSSARRCSSALARGEEARALDGTRSSARADRLVAGGLLLDDVVRARVERPRAERVGAERRRADPTTRPGARAITRAIVAAPRARSTSRSRSMASRARSLVEGQRAASASSAVVDVEATLEQRARDGSSRARVGVDDEHAPRARPDRACSRAGPTPARLAAPSGPAPRRSPACRCTPAAGTRRCGCRPRCFAWPSAESAARSSVSFVRTRRARDRATRRSTR